MQAHQAEAHQAAGDGEAQGAPAQPAVRPAPGGVGRKDRRAHKRELKAAKVKWRAAWALRDERFEELDDFEQALLDDGTHDAAGIQVLSAAEVAPRGYYWRDELGLKGVQLFA